MKVKNCFTHLYCMFLVMWEKAFPPHSTSESANITIPTMPACKQIEVEAGYWVAIDNKDGSRINQPLKENEYRIQPEGKFSIKVKGKWVDIPEANGITLYRRL